VTLNKTLTAPPGTSRIAVRTRAVGVFARLAHDLELSTTDLRVEATLVGREWTAIVTVPVAHLRVAGTLKGDRLDAAGLAPRDRVDVERKMGNEVLAVGEVTARGHGTLDDAGAGGGGELEVNVGSSRGLTGVGFTAKALSGGAYSVTGRCTLSLKELGIGPVKGPLGAFKLRDDVEVLFEATLLPEGREAREP
jgi:hypothetical protein